jgi:hypothetical protein
MEPNYPAGSQIQTNKASSCIPVFAQWLSDVVAGLLVQHGGGAKVKLPSRTRTENNFLKFFSRQQMTKWASQTS